jgi:hypothetical protein
LPGLVGGERQAQAVGRQEIGEAARGRNRGLLLLLLLLLLRRGLLRRRAFG